MFENFYFRSIIQVVVFNKPSHQGGIRIPEPDH